jgi:DNA-binding transcriptional ArsR family regulator
MEAMQETTDDRDSEAARGSGTGLVTQIRTVADDDQNTRSLHEVQNLMEAMQEIPDDGQTKVSQNLDTGLVSHEPTVTGQYATPEPLQHVAQLDDRRLLLSKWIPTSDDENCVFHHGPTDFVVAGNGYRLCPALLLNATLFQVILDTAKANQHIRSSTRMIEQNSAPLRKRREHVALQIGRKEAVRARLWDELDELKAQEGRMFDENDHTELVEKIDKVGEDLEELEREADEVEASIGDCSGPDLAGTRAQLSTLHWQADRIIETALVRIGYLPAADEPTLRTAYPEENDRWLAYELSNSKQELEKIEAELFLYRDNYNSQFKHWAVPYKSSKSLEKLEEDFGAVWVRRGQKLARDLAQAERECTALKEEKPEVTKGLEKLEKSGLVNVDYDRAVDKAGYYELRVDKKRKWVDDWVPEWTPEEGPFPHPPPPSSSRSIASIRTVGSPIPPSVSGPEKKQPSQRSSKQRNDRRTRQVSPDALYRKSSSTCVCSAPPLDCKRRKLDVNTKSRRRSV